MFSEKLFLQLNTLALDNDRFPYISPAPLSAAKFGGLFVRKYVRKSFDRKRQFITI